MYSMSLVVLAVQQLAFSAVMAIPAELRVISRHFVSNLEAFYQLAHLNHDAAALMSSDHRDGGIEIAIMDM